MEKEIVEMLCSNLKWYDRIVVRIFKKIFIRTFNNYRVNLFNVILD